jgi:hypothetical protein
MHSTRSKAALCYAHQQSRTNRAAPFGMHSRVAAPCKIFYFYVGEGGEGQSHVGAADRHGNVRVWQRLADPTPHRPHRTHLLCWRILHTFSHTSLGCNAILRHVCRNCASSPCCAAPACAAASFFLLRDRPYSKGEATNRQRHKGRTGSTRAQGQRNHSKTGTETEERVTAERGIAGTADRKPDGDRDRGRGNKQRTRDWDSRQEARRRRRQEAGETNRRPGT